MKKAALNFIARKSIRLLLLLASVSSFSYVLVSCSPIDPVDAYLGPSILKVSPEQREKIAQRWGFDRSPVERFFRWGGHLIRGHFGISTIFNEPVLSVLGKRFLTSFWLMLFAWLISGMFGFVLGLLSGRFENRVIDKAIGFYAYTMASTPTFWVGMVLPTFFSIQLNWAPVCCAWPVGLDPAAATIWQRLHHLLLPAVTLSLIGVAQIALHTREKTIEAMHGDYALFARAQSETELRNRCAIFPWGCGGWPWRRALPLFLRLKLSICWVAIFGPCWIREPVMNRRPVILCWR